MDKDLESKIYEMHGMVQRLDQKTDNVLEKQGRFDQRIKNNSKEIDKVDAKAQENKKKLYAASLIGSLGLTAATIIAAFAGGFP